MAAIFNREVTMSNECDHDWENITGLGDKEQKLICTYCDKSTTAPLSGIPRGAELTDGESYYCHLYHDQYEMWNGIEWVRCNFVPTDLVAIQTNGA